MNINDYLKTSKILDDTFPELESTPDSPFTLFNKWLSDAFESGSDEPAVMVLSTVEDHTPDSRVVLLKAVDDSGLYFETAKPRSKVRQLHGNHSVAANFYWTPLGRQVRIQGTAVLTDDFSHVADNLDAPERDLNVYHIIPSRFEFYQAVTAGYKRFEYVLEDSRWLQHTL